MTKISAAAYTIASFSGELTIPKLQTLRPAFQAHGEEILN